MKKNGILAGFAALAMLGLVSAPIAAADEMIHKETTTKTTTYSGTVSEISPSSSIVVRSESAAQPMRYKLTEQTTFVDSEGNVVTAEQVRNVPVTVHYTQQGSDMVVSRVVATRPIIQKKTTTTTTTSD